METITFDCNEDLFRGKRALHLVAAGGGPLALLHLLLVAGALVDAKDGVSLCVGYTIYSCEWREWRLCVCMYVCACVRAWLTWALPPARLLSRLQDQNTPLHLAAEKGLEGVCAELLRYKADANAKNRVSLSTCSRTHARITCAREREREREEARLRCCTCS